MPAQPSYSQPKAQPRARPAQSTLHPTHDEPETFRAHLLSPAFTLHIFLSHILYIIYYTRVREGRAGGSSDAASSQREDSCQPSTHLSFDQPATQLLRREQQQPNHISQFYSEQHRQQPAGGILPAATFSKITFSISTFRKLGQLYSSPKNYSRPSTALLWLG